jgi:hypothetical protein
MLERHYENREFRERECCLGEKKVVLASLLGLAAPPFT